MTHRPQSAGSAKALVWFKRDLRVRDHAPLAEAVNFENALGLVVIEPQWLQSPECDPRHVGYGSRKSGLPPSATRRRRARVATAAVDDQGLLF